MENNKLIAEFMGLGKAEPYYIEDENNQETNLVFSPALKYNSDWNWLMEVVEKIESLGYRVTIVRHICRIDLTEESKLIISEDIKKIEAVYTACLEFIKWYNKNNK